MPIALRMPIWRDFCMTEIASTLAMARTTDTTTNTWIMMLDTLWPLRPDSSCSFCAFQLVTSRSMSSGSACSSAAIVSARKTSPLSTCISIDVTWPARSSCS